MNLLPKHQDLSFQRRPRSKWIEDETEDQFDETQHPAQRRLNSTWMRMKKIADRHLPFPRVRHANRIQITAATGGRSRRFDRRACCRDQNIDPELNELLS